MFREERVGVVVGVIVEKEEIEDGKLNGVVVSEVVDKNLFILICYFLYII